MAQSSPHVRAVVASKLALEIDSPTLTENELKIAYDIIGVMAKDVDVVVRRAVAHSLRRSKHLPHDVALRLAHDIEAVALPILRDCFVLTDDDLIEVLQSSGAVKQKAIAARLNVSEKVLEVVVDTTNEAVVATLLANKTAKITDFSLHKALSRFSHSDLVKETMVMREKLPVTVAEKLVTMISSVLQDYMMAHHELPPSIAAEILIQGRERAVIQISQGVSNEDTERLVEQMHLNNRLTPALVLRALCVGNLPFFEFAMAALANISVVNARLLIHHAGVDGLKSIGEKADMPFPQFTSVVSLVLAVMNQLKLDGGEGDIKRFRTRLIERLLTQGDLISQKDMDYLAELIK
jgi:uncharacterized protein (DUF2336 family)